MHSSATLEYLYFMLQLLESPYNCGQRVVGCALIQEKKARTLRKGQAELLPRLPIRSL